MAEPKYPNITVALTGEDGNAFAILGRVTRAMRREGISKEEQDEFFRQATMGDYQHLLKTCGEWVDVE